VSSLPPEFFRRQDERPDDQFYAVPRPASHLDERADRVVAGWYDELLPSSGCVLDLFAGSASHLPERIPAVIGVGLDAAALERNERLPGGPPPPPHPPPAPPPPPRPPPPPG